MLGGARAAWPEPAAHHSPAACFSLALSSDKAPAQQEEFVWVLFFFVEEAQAEVEG